MMIDAEMYGMIFSAKIVILANAPPDNILNMSRIPPACCWKISCRMDGSMPEYPGAKPIDNQRTQRKPDAFLELGSLRKI